MPDSVLDLQVVLIEDETGWTAHGLQYSLSASAPTLSEVLYAFERAVVGHIAVANDQGLEPFQSIPPAPQKVWDLWNAGRTLQFDPFPNFRVDRGLTLPRPHPEFRLASAA